MTPKAQISTYEPVPVAVNSVERRSRGTVEDRVFNQEYIDSLVRGDPEVARHFSDHFGQMLLVKLRGRLKCPQSIADARQETFTRVLHALRKNGTIAHPERLGGFVNGVCENVLLEFFRSGKRAVQMPENGPDVQDEKDSTEYELITDERKRLVNKTMESLPEKDRRLLRLLFFEERGRDEVCDELNIDRERLRVRLFRALKRFRECVEEKAPRGTFDDGDLS